jgi:hypothetical protein
VQIASWLLVITIVGEDACFRIDGIRPVRIVHARCQNEHLELPFDLPSVTKSALTIDTHQSWQRVVASVCLSVRPDKWRPRTGPMNQANLIGLFSFQTMA